MVFDYITDAHGLSAHPQKKRSRQRLSIPRMLFGEQNVLSRALCSFDSRPLPSKLQGEKLKSALELAAKTASPHEQPGIFIFIGDKRAAIWTYDVEKLKLMPGVSVRGIVPESALHAPANGAVLREVLEGYEGQYWLDGELVASRWWATPVSQSDWQLFCLSAERFGAADAARPEAQLPARRKKTPSNDITFMSQINLISLSVWAWVFAALLSLLVLYFGTRYSYLSVSASSMQSEYETLWQEKSEQRARALRVSALDSKNAFIAELYNSSHPLPGLAEALTAALSDGGQIDSIFYDSFVFEISFTRSGTFSQRDFVAELELSRYISNVSLVQGQRPNLWELTFTHATEDSA